MALGSESTDALLEWEPGPTSAAHANPMAAFAWGVRRSLNCKLLLAYLWLFHLLLVDGLGGQVLAYLRSQATVMEAWSALLQAAPVGTVYGSPFLQGTYRALVLESVTRQLFVPSPFFLLFYGVIAGGIIAYVHSPRPAPLLAQLGAQCGAFAGRFMRLLAVAGLFLWGVVAVVNALSAESLSGDNVWIGLVGLLLSLAAAAAVIDYARVRTVARDSRSMLLETVRSTRFFVVHLPRTAALEAILVLAVTALAIVSMGIHYALQAMLPHEIADFLTQQVLVVGLLGLRVAAWGAMLSLYQGITLQGMQRSRTADQVTD